MYQTNSTYFPPTSFVMAHDTFQPAGFLCLVKPFLSYNTARNMTEMASTPDTNKIGVG